MAEIDKGLPNVRRTVTLPSQRQELTEVANRTTRTLYLLLKVRRLLENEDGSVDIRF